MTKVIKAKPLGTNAEVKNASATDAVQFTADDAAYTTEHDAVEYKVKRQEEYPDIGDQLDVIWKYLNQKRLGGENLPQEADNMLGGILAIKNKHQKPE